MARGRGNLATYTVSTRGTAGPGPTPQSPQVAWHKCSEEARFLALAKGHACEREGELWRLGLQRVKAAPRGGCRWRPVLRGSRWLRRRLWVEAHAQSSELSPHCSLPAVTLELLSCCALSALSCLQGHEGSASLQEGRFLVKLLFPRSSPGTGRSAAPMCWGMSSAFEGSSAALRLGGCRPCGDLGQQERPLPGVSLSPFLK